ncbi:MAG: SWIM zinc finger family protein [Thermoguttaceae bacterium]|jgi:uncharacterized Zn finger protein|nr:SWIM zinc finger family protein [Thermoguttaceae bacterium]
MAYFQWAPYVPVAVRRRRAMKKMEALRKKGVDIQPVEIEGRTIARTFWGAGWCDHLEGFSDFENRLPRGRTYVRNGSVCHLAISRGKIEAKVSGSELYNVTIQIKTLAAKKWKDVKQRCGGAIGSLLELLEGRLSDHVMGVVTDRKEGLFPLPGEMSFRCSCPDWAVMCKHVAAVLYGVGNRFDHRPELLFELRGVNHEELIRADAEAAVSAATQRGKAKRLAADDLADVFGIDLDADEAPQPDQKPARRKATTKKSKPVKKTKAAKKTVVAKKTKAAKKTKTVRKAKTVKRAKAAK